MKQTNQIKVYKDTKTADYTLQLYLIKRHIFLEKCSERYEIKTVYSKKYDEELSFVRSSIKN